MVLFRRSCTPSDNRCASIANDLVAVIEQDLDDTSYRRGKRGRQFRCRRPAKHTRVSVLLHNPFTTSFGRASRTHVRTPSTRLVAIAAASFISVGSEHLQLLFVIHRLYSSASTYSCNFAKDLEMEEATLTASFHRFPNQLASYAVIIQ